MSSRMPSERFDQRVAALLRAYGDGGVTDFDPREVARMAIDSGTNRGGFIGALRRATDRRMEWLRGGTAISVEGLVRAVAIGLAIVVGAYLLGRPTGNVGAPSPTAAFPTPTPSATPNPPSQAPSKPAARSVQPEATMTLHSSVGGIVAGSDAIWAAAAGGVVRIDPITNKVDESSLGVGWLLAVDGNDVWVTGMTDAVDHIDWLARKKLASVRVDPSPEGVIVADGSAWVASNATGAVSRIDPATDSVVSVIGPGDGGGNAQRLGAGLGSIWAGEADGSLVLRIDTDTNQATARIQIRGSVPCGGFAIEPAVVWAAGCGGHATIAAIDPANNTWVATVPIPGDPGIPILIDGLVWVPIIRDANGNGCCVIAIDPATNTVVDAISVEGGPTGGAVVAFGSVWFTVGHGLGGIPGGNAVVRMPLSSFRAAG
jgi:virginiamycin B lyase